MISPWNVELPPWFDDSLPVYAQPTVVIHVEHFVQTDFDYMLAVVNVAPQVIIV